MSEASLLCLQNDLLCCVKEGKELFRCHKNKGLDNIRLQRQCRHVSEELTPQSLNVKLGPRRNYHKGRAAIRHYANQTARPL